MKKYYWIIGIMFAISIFVSIVYSAPAPNFLALNHETKECGIYWPGDERIFNELPSSWKSYDVIKNYYKRSSYADFFVETEVGICNFTYNYETIKYHGEFEKCCNQLGYTYVSTNISGNERIIYPTQQYNEEIFLSIFLIILFLALFILFFYFRKKGKKK